MEEEKEEIDLKNGINLVLSDRPSSDEISSGTDGSFFEEEDKNLIEKEINNKKNVITNTISFTNKFESIKNGNILYYFYCKNLRALILMNIISIILFLSALIFELIFQIFFNLKMITNYYIIIISMMMIPFLICTLIKMIMIFQKLEQKDNEDDTENKDLIRLIQQILNIYYSISLFLFSINYLTKLIFIEILNYHFKIIITFELLIIFLSLFIFGIIYFLTKSSNNILITNLMDMISFPLSISVYFSFLIINNIEQIKSLIYNGPIYAFLLTCVSLLLMVYYDDVLCAFFIFLYQLGEIKHISFYNMNFNTFCALINFGFIIFMTFKSIRKYFFIKNDDNDNYILLNEEVTVTNEDKMSD